MTGVGAKTEEGCGVVAEVLVIAGSDDVAMAAELAIQQQREQSGLVACVRLHSIQYKHHME